MSGALSGHSGVGELEDTDRCGSVCGLGKTEATSKEVVKHVQSLLARVSAPGPGSSPDFVCDPALIWPWSV